MTETSTYAGVDVAKDRLDVVLRPSGEYLEANNDEAGIRSVVRRLRNGDVELVVLEATGGLEQLAAASLAVAGVPVAIVNPQQVRDFAKATGRLAKTAREAAVLAHFANAVRPEPRPLADEHGRELSAVLLRRHQILTMVTAEGNRARTAPKAVKKRIEAHLRSPLYLSRKEDLGTRNSGVSYPEGSGRGVRRSVRECREHTGTNIAAWTFATRTWWTSPSSAAWPMRPWSWITTPE